jgi:hypothetical protein
VITPTPSRREPRLVRGASGRPLTASTPLGVAIASTRRCLVNLDAHLFVYRINCERASLCAVLGGFDALVFIVAIRENAAARICRQYDHTP